MDPTSDTASTLELWNRHLLNLLSPLTAFFYLACGPYPWYWVIPWAIPAMFVYTNDWRNRPVRNRKTEVVAHWPFTAVLMVHAGLQFANTVLFIRFQYVSELGSAATWAAIPIMAGATGCTGLVVAHELIHRRNRWSRFLGRAMLVTLLYEHFYTEHLRGHHPRVGTPADPATAYFGETYWHFLWRTIPGQFVSAWRLEARRVRAGSARFSFLRPLQNRVLQGVVAECALLAGCLAWGGPVVTILFIAQAFMAVMLIEAVNYFEHWGLTRSNPNSVDDVTWDSESWLSHYSLVGLARHTDHHAVATRPYYELRARPASPQLPMGYSALIGLAVFRNAKFRRLLTAELQRRGLGPFARAANATAASEPARAASRT